MKIRNILLVPEIILLAVFVLPILSHIINPGNIAGIILNLVLIAVTLFWNKLYSICKHLWEYKSGKIFLIVVSALIIAGVIYILVLTVFMISAKEKSPDNAKAVVVLGCKVNGETPSKMLKRRLDAAEFFLSENPQTICVVSGGKGDDEKISEAQAMKKYLVEKGIDESRIFMEDKSVNTLENLKNSCEILDGLGIEKNIAIVTDGFHQYRAGYIAENLGYSPAAINAVPDFYNVALTPTYYVREWMAITNEYLKNI